MKFITRVCVFTLLCCAGCGEDGNFAADSELNARISSLSSSMTNGFNAVLFDKEIRRVLMKNETLKLSEYIDVYRKSILSVSIYTSECEESAELLYVRFDCMMGIMKCFSEAASQCSLPCRERLLMVLEVAEHLKRESAYIKMRGKRLSGQHSKKIIVENVAEKIMVYREGWLSLHIDSGVWLENYIRSLPQAERSTIMQKIKAVMGRCPIWIESASR